MQSDQASSERDLGDLSPEAAELSERETEILRLVATGASNKEIAQQLFISPNTVKVHLRNSFSKIGVVSRTEAALYAIRQGLIEVASSNRALSSPVNASAKERAWHRNWVGLLRSWPLAAALVLLALGGLTWTILRDREAPDSAAPSPPSSTSIDRWGSRSALPTARAGLAVTSYEGFIYAIAGETRQGVIGVMERYDPITDRWTTLPPKPTAVSDVQAVVVGGEIFVPGGRTSPTGLTNVLEVFHPREERWDQRAPLPQALSAYALVAFEGRIFLFGGWDGETFVASVYEYDRENDAWKELAPMRVARGFAGAATVGGEIHIIGGYDGEQSLTIHESFSPAESSGGEMSWNQRAPLPYGRYAMGAASVADIIHVIGGVGNDNQELPPLKYFLHTDSWQIFEAPPSGSPWSHLGLIPIQTHLYAFGGMLNHDTSDQVLTYEAVYTVAIPLLP